MKKQIKEAKAAKQTKIVKAELPAPPAEVIVDLTPSTPVLLLPLFPAKRSAELVLKGAKLETARIRERLERVKANLKAQKAAIKAAKKEEKEAAKTPKYTRADAFAQAIKDGAGKKEEIIKLSAKIYAEKTGNDINEKEAAWYANTTIPGLIALGLADMKEGVLAVFFPVAKAA